MVFVRHKIILRPGVLLGAADVESFLVKTSYWPGSGKKTKTDKTFLGSLHLRQKSRRQPKLGVRKYDANP